jgi:hypothetical protein
VHCEGKLWVKKHNLYQQVYHVVVIWNSSKTLSHTLQVKTRPSKDNHNLSVRLLMVLLTGYAFHFCSLQSQVVRHRTQKASWSKSRKFPCCASAAPGEAALSFGLEFFASELTAGRLCFKLYSVSLKVSWCIPTYLWRFLACIFLPQPGDIFMLYQPSWVPHFTSEPITAVAFPCTLLGLHGTWSLDR